MSRSDEIPELNLIWMPSPEEMDRMYRTSTQDTDTTGYNSALDVLLILARRVEQARDQYVMIGNGTEHEKRKRLLDAEERFLNAAVAVASEADRIGRFR